MGLGGWIRKQLKDAKRMIEETLARLKKKRSDDAIACQHFCLFKKAGSNFKNAHVHFLRPIPPAIDLGIFTYSGLGHDDETPGMSNTPDPKHNSLSWGTNCEFRPSPPQVPGIPRQALTGRDLNMDEWEQGYFYPAVEGQCAEGYRLVKCECGDMCLTYDVHAFKKWAGEE